MMKNNSFVTAEQISSELNISVRAVEKQIRNLREKGQIVRIGGKNGGHWEVKINNESITRTNQNL